MKVRVGLLLNTALYLPVCDKLQNATVGFHGVTLLHEGFVLGYSEDVSVKSHAIYGV
jgi:hypothetical protein